MSKTIKPEIVAKKVLKEILKNKAENYITRSTGILFKIIMFFPNRILKIESKLEKKGEKKKEEFLKHLDI